MDVGEWAFNEPPNAPPHAHCPRLHRWLEGRGREIFFTKNHPLFLSLPPSPQVYHKIQRLCSGRTSTLSQYGPPRKSMEADLDGLLDPRYIDKRIAANDCLTVQQLKAHLGSLARLRGSPYAQGEPSTTQLKELIERYNERHANSEDRPIIGLKNAKLTSTARAAFSGNHTKVLRCQVCISWPRPPRPTTTHAHMPPPSPPVPCPQQKL